MWEGGTQMHSSSRQSPAATPCSLPWLRPRLQAPPQPHQHISNTKQEHHAVGNFPTCRALEGSTLLLMPSRPAGMLRWNQGWAMISGIVTRCPDSFTSMRLQQAQARARVAAGRQRSC